MPHNFRIELSIFAGFSCTYKLKYTHFTILNKTLQAEIKVKSYRLAILLMVLSLVVGCSKLSSYISSDTPPAKPNKVKTTLKHEDNKSDRLKTTLKHEDNKSDERAKYVTLTGKATIGYGINVFESDPPNNAAMYIVTPCIGKLKPRKDQTVKASGYIAYDKDYPSFLVENSRNINE